MAIAMMNVTANQLAIDQRNIFDAFVAAGFTGAETS